MNKGNPKTQSGRPSIYKVYRQAWWLNKSLSTCGLRVPTEGKSLAGTGNRTKSSRFIQIWKYGCGKHFLLGTRSLDETFQVLNPLKCLSGTETRTKISRFPQIWTFQAWITCSFPVLIFIYSFPKSPTFSLEPHNILFFLVWYC